MAYCASQGRLTRHVFGTSLVDCFERDAAGLDVGRDRVDDGVCTSDGTRDLAAIAYVRATYGDLLQTVCTKGPARAFGVADRYAHAVTRANQSLRESSTKKPGTTE